MSVTREDEVILGFVLRQLGNQAGSFKEVRKVAAHHAYCVARIQGEDRDAASQFATSVRSRMRTLMDARDPGPAAPATSATAAGSPS